MALPIGPGPVPWKVFHIRNLGSLANFPHSGRSTKYTVALVGEPLRRRGHQHGAVWKHPWWVGIRDGLLAEGSGDASLSRQVLPRNPQPSSSLSRRHRILKIHSVYSKAKRSLCYRHIRPISPAAGDSGRGGEMTASKHWEPGASLVIQQTLTMI